MTRAVTYPMVEEGKQRIIKLPNVLPAPTKKSRTPIYSGFFLVPSGIRLITNSAMLVAGLYTKLVIRPEQRLRAKMVKGEKEKNINRAGIIIKVTPAAIEGIRRSGRIQRPARKAAKIASAPVPKFCRPVKNSLSTSWEKQHADKKGKGTVPKACNGSPLPSCADNPGCFLDPEAPLENKFFVPPAFLEEDEKNRPPCTQGIRCKWSTAQNSR